MTRNARRAALVLLTALAMAWPMAPALAKGHKPAPSPSPAPVVTGPDCGATVTKPDGSAWTCAFADNFDGTQLNSQNWAPTETAKSGYRVGPECYVNSPNNIAVKNGTLLLTARKEAKPFTCASPSGSFTTQYTSGSVTSYGLQSWTYGRFEVRAKFPPATVAGLHSALWMMPQNPIYGPWPYSGEIDIAERYSQYPDLPIPYIHYGNVFDPNVTSYTCSVDDASQFHDYTLEWTRTTLRIKYDDKTCLTDTWTPTPASASGTAPFDQPFFMALTQALGVATNAFDPVTTPLPATTAVDYVHVWK